MFSVASFLRRVVLALFNTSGSPEYKALAEAQKDLATKPGVAKQRLTMARGVIESKGSKAGEGYFKKFIESLERLNPMNRKQMATSIDEALAAIHEDAEWRKPFEQAREALKTGDFTVEGQMPDLYQGTVTHIDEAIKAIGEGTPDKAKPHIDFAMNLYRACTPLIIRQQFTPL